MPLIDFAILTGLTEEFEILQRVFPAFAEVSENEQVWYRTRIASSSGENRYEVVASFQNEMGPLDAHDLTAKLISRWEPAYIVLVGVAGSFQKDVMLGDVLVSQQVFYYDLGKVESGRIKYRPQGYPCSPVLVRQAEALRLDRSAFGAWQEAAARSASDKGNQLSGKNPEAVRAAKAELAAHRPNVHFGTLASGSLVIADKAKQGELLALHGKIIGTEMEGAGVLHAGFRQEIPPHAVVIKGVSDAADSNKAREDAKAYWRELAKESAIRFALELIRRGRIRPLRTDQFDLDASTGSVAEARAVIPDVSAPGVSYLSFPQLVLPRGPLTEVRIEIDARGECGPVAVHKVVVDYLGWDGNRKRLDAGAATTVHLPGPVARGPVGVYALLRGTASLIGMTVTTPGDKKQAEWRPGS